MTDIDLRAPVLLACGCYCLTWITLRASGLPTLGWRMKPEKVAAWRQLGKWKFLALQGILCWTLPMAVLVFTLQYSQRQFLLRGFNVYHVPTYKQFLGYLVEIAMLVACGLGSGLSSWRKLWSARYDPVVGSEEHPSSQEAL